MNNIVWFDLETTGLNISSDRIIEICMIKTNLDGEFIDKFYSLVNPGNVQIKKEAAEKHGISANDLNGQKYFSEIANDIIEFIGDSHIGGYNIVRFDLPFIIEEFLNCGIVFNYRKRTIIDSFLIYSKYEPRDLTSVYKKYTGKILEGAHGAESDIKATIEIFNSQIDLYNIERSFDSLNDLDDTSTRVDLSGKFKIIKDNEKSEIVFNFGKWIGVSFRDVLKKDSSYIDWFINKSEFPRESKLIAKKLKQSLL